jgi:hypothetical protein
MAPDVHHNPREGNVVRYAIARGNSVDRAAGATGEVAGRWQIEGLPTIKLER